MEYSRLVSVYSSVESSSKRLDKTYYVAKILNEASGEDLPRILLLLQGRVFPIWDQRELGIASQLMIKALAKGSGAPESECLKLWKETGDLGLTAERLLSRKRQASLFSQKLSIAKVFSNLQGIAALEGKGTVSKKMALVSELLTSATPIEAKYITRTLIGTLRIGIGEGVIRDAIAWAFLPKVHGLFLACGACSKIVPAGDNCPECKAHLQDSAGTPKGKGTAIVKSLDDLKTLNLRNVDLIVPESPELGRDIYNFMLSAIEEGFAITNDFGRLAAVLEKDSLKGLLRLEIEVFTPIKAMLAIKVESISEGLERVGTPCLLDFKYDGFRMQVHKQGDKVMLFTRRLENVTEQFAELVPAIKGQVEGESFVLDGEAIGYDAKTLKYRPFQEISQRIKRKYGIEDMAQRLPVELNLFDIVYYNGKTLLQTPYRERKKLLEKIVTPLAFKLRLAESRVVSTQGEAEEFFNRAIRAGHEGIMFKKLDAGYKPGARIGYMAKFKPTADSVELVIIGAEYGEGKRAGWLTSYKLACKRGEEYAPVGNASTGLKEKPEEGLSFVEMTELLKPLIISSKGREVEVKPEIVVEVGYQEIQKSPSYSSGYALRFPRIIRLRQDKSVEEIASTEDIERLYDKQATRGS